MNVRITSLLRAVGAAAGVLVDGRVPAAMATGSTYAASRAVEPGGVALLSVSVDDDRLPPWVNKAVPEVTAALSWMLVNQLLRPMVRRLPVPRVVGAVGYAAALYVLDDRLTAMGQRMLEAAQEQSATPAEEPATSD